VPTCGVLHLGGLGSFLEAYLTVPVGKEHELHRLELFIPQIHGAWLLAEPSMAVQKPEREVSVFAA
jgi:hypothetical protein